MGDDAKQAMKQAIDKKIEEGKAEAEALQQQLPPQKKKSAVTSEVTNAAKKKDPVSIGASSVDSPDPDHPCSARIGPKA